MSSRKKRNHQIPKQGEVIEITARKCSEKQSPLIEVGKSYICKGVSSLKDGTTVIEVVHPTKKKQTLRVNALRFDWQILTDEMKFEREFREGVRKDTEKMMNSFTQREHIQMAFIPLIFADLAFNYADKCRRYAADQRIEILKKLGRAYDEVKRNYFESVSKDLDRKHQRNVEQEMARFMEEYKKDFTILWFSVNAEFKKKMPDYPYSDMRTDAICGMLMVDLLYQNNTHMDEVIAERLGEKRQSIHDPKIDALRSILDAYAGEVGQFDYKNENVELAKNIILRRVNEIEFNITND